MYNFPARAEKTCWTSRTLAKQSTYFLWRRGNCAALSWCFVHIMNAQEQYVPSQYPRLENNSLGTALNVFLCFDSYNARIQLLSQFHTRCNILRTICVPETHPVKTLSFASLYRKAPLLLQRLNIHIRMRTECCTQSVVLPTKPPRTSGSYSRLVSAWKSMVFFSTVWVPN